MGPLVPKICALLHPKSSSCFLSFDRHAFHVGTLEVDNSTYWSGQVLAGSGTVADPRSLHSDMHRYLAGEAKLPYTTAERRQTFNAVPSAQAGTLEAFL